MVNEISLASLLKPYFDREELLQFQQVVTNCKRFQKRPAGSINNPAILKMTAKQKEIWSKWSKNFLLFTVFKEQCDTELVQMCSLCLASSDTGAKKDLVAQEGAGLREGLDIG